MSIDYSERIPNNVDLAEDRRLQRALGSWQPRFLQWWGEMGPTLPTQDVYLRTAVDVGREGWAHFDRVRVPDYRWGIFLAERNPGRRIGFGQHKGEPVWQQVPGEHRASLQRLIVVQGDTEPAWQNWIFVRPNASGPEGALRKYGTGQRPEFDRTRV